MDLFVPPYHHNSQCTNANQSNSSMLQSHSQEVDLKGSMPYEELVCTAIVVKESDGFCLRANTVANYIDANLKITKQTSTTRAPLNAEISPKTQVECTHLLFYLFFNRSELILSLETVQRLVKDVR